MYVLKGRFDKGLGDMTVDMSTRHRAPRSPDLDKLKLQAYTPGVAFENFFDVFFFETVQEGLRDEVFYG